MELAEFFAKYDEVPNLRGADFAELEVSKWSEGFRFEGIAAVFDMPFEVPDKQYRESVEHGAFRKALSTGGNIPMLYNHGLKSDQVPLATTGAGTMQLREVAKGLAVVADVADTQLGRDIRTSAKRGDIRGMSYGMKTGRGNAQYSRTRDGWVHRSIKTINRILDVSPTWNPAHPDTLAEFRSLGALAQQVAESPDPLQQILMGADLAQLEEGAVESEETAEPSPPSGVSEEATPLLAARERQLALLSLTLEGGDFE